MRKRGIDKDVVVLLISTLLTVASWVGFEVYRAYVKIQVPENVEVHLKEINPMLDRNFFDKLKAERGIYEE